MKQTSRINMPVKYFIDLRRKYLIFEEEEIDPYTDFGVIDVSVTGNTVRHKNVSIMGGEIVIFNPTIDTNTEIFINVRKMPECKTHMTCGWNTYQIMVAFPQDTARLKLHQDRETMWSEASNASKSFLWRTTHKEMCEITKAKFEPIPDFDITKPYEIHICYIGLICGDCFQAAQFQTFQGWGRVPKNSAFFKAISN